VSVTMTDEWVTIREAAQALGVSESAVRKRLSRGTLTHERRSDGRVYILLDEVSDTSNTHASHTLTSSQMDDLRDQIEFLREELRRKDSIILTMAQRIPELEPAPEPRESPVTSSDTGVKGDVPEEESRPWWRRWFGA
jgi:hypothetical protein